MLWSPRDWVSRVYFARNIEYSRVFGSKIRSDGASRVHFEYLTHKPLKYKHYIHFCPRLRDFQDRRLASIGPPSAYPGLAPIMGRKVRADVVKEHWAEILRLVASLKAGHAAPSAMLRKLAAYERQNQLAVALQEVRKIERTLFMLDRLENPALRRRCQTGLNKGEQRHALMQAI